MVFSSNLFLCIFLPIFLLLLFITPLKYRNYTIVFASVLFYAWGAPRFVFVLMASLILDFFLAKAIYKANAKRKKALLIFSIIISVGMMMYFKYVNFFIENVNAVLDGIGIDQMNVLNIALPIGISFFTFHQLSYIIDVYRGVKEPMNKLSDYGLYILLFPQLVAGPIIRFNEIADQIKDRRNQETIDNKLLGLYRFIIGLSKKVIIANAMAVVADQYFNKSVSDITTLEAWVGVLAYTFQIYFDFSGYSDMAIGLARMMGFIFPENFNNPYIAQSITDFWRRWHMTLSRWMRDYLYIPLGGNKVSTRRMYINLWIVFLLSGFWHGASWNFIVWGIFHGTFLILDRIFLIRLLSKLASPFRIMITFIIIMIGWVFFRSATLTQAIEYLDKMFSLPESFDINLSHRFIILAIAALIFSFIGAVKNAEEKQLAYYSLLTKKRFVFLSIACSCLFVWSLAEVTVTGFNPFIYFRF